MNIPTSILEAAQAIILVLDTKANIVTYNRFLEELSGYPLADMKGKDWIESFLPASDRAHVRELFQRTLDDPDESLGYVNPIITADGQLIEIEWSSSQIRNGQVSGLVCVGLDVSERVKLNRARESLEKQKTQFMANVSHELRTPLSLIKGYMSILLSKDSDFSDLTDLTPEQRRIGALIMKRVQELTWLINDILTYQELEDPAALQYIRARTVDLLDVVQAVQISFEPLAKDKGLELHCFRCDQPVEVRGARHMLGRAVSNLIMNAIKFTPSGQVTLAVFRADGQAVVEVSDTGIGIPEDQQDLIFQRFYQMDSSDKRKFGGSGLGLAVVQEIVKAHAGRIELESTPGMGSTFRIYLPLDEQTDV